MSVPTVAGPLDLDVVLFFDEALAHLLAQGRYLDKAPGSSVRLYGLGEELGLSALVVDLVVDACADVDEADVCAALEVLCELGGLQLSSAVCAQLGVPV